MKWHLLFLAFGLSIILTRSEVYNYDHLRVTTALQKVLSENGIVCSFQKDGVIMTESKDVDLKTINGFIKEDMPSENPGWEKGRFRLEIVIRRINPNKTELKIEPKFERFGVFSALVLIPPAWTPSISNGKLESMIYEAVKNRLQAEISPTQRDLRE